MVRDTRKPPHKLTSTQGQQNEWPQFMDTGSAKASSWHRAQATSPAAIISARGEGEGRRVRGRREGEGCRRGRGGRRAGGRRAGGRRAGG
jgi:hypothetical protein